MDSQAWLPRIDRNICTGCKACVGACPTQALAQVEGKAALVRPDACTYCSACESLCPVYAIELPYLIVKASNYGDQSNAQVL